MVSSCACCVTHGFYEENNPVQLSGSNPEQHVAQHARVARPGLEYTSTACESLASAQVYMLFKQQM